jgi:ATP-dependent Clp protease ATP-binding subunit ClpA
MEVDSKPEELDEVERKLVQLKIEREALKRETDAASKERLEKLGVSARLYSGKRDEDDWNARKFRVLLLQEQSAFGLNLHEPCRDTFHYTYTWNAELWQQMNERCGPARQAQAGKKVVSRVWYAQAVDTIESEVIDSNFRKITVEQALKRARAQRLQ